MNLVEFKTLIADFKKRIMKGRYVYLWHGTERGLDDILPQDVTSRMDIVETIRNVDISECVADEIDRLIKKQISRELTNHSNLPEPHILVVTNAYLMARYKTGLQMYYDNFVGDGRMLILQVAKWYIETVRLPSFVNFEPETCFNYLAKLVESDHVIEEGE